LLVEERVPLRRELAAMVARSPFGQVAAYPVVETVQRDGICVEVLAPAPGLPAETAVAAQELAIRIATELDVVGVLAVEMFQTAGGADGASGDAGPRVLVNELAMRERLTAAGIPVPRWRRVGTVAELAGFAAELGGWPVVLKTARGGYDGRGVWPVESAAEAEPVLAAAASASGPGLLAEERVDFVRELAVVLARSPYGQVAVYPVVETVQRGGICREVLAPAPGLRTEVALAAVQTAMTIAAELDCTGVLAVEMFETARGVLVNELAMRPHNSAHWTIDGAVTSQFEQHLRAVLDLPLGTPTARAPASVMVNVLGGDDPDVYRRYLHCMARDPALRIHMYGKQVRPGRKIGHVTVSGSGYHELRERAWHAADYLSGAIDG